jgi:integrase
LDISLPLYATILAMASIIKKSSSKFFFACFRDVNGRQWRKTTREVDRKKALKIAEVYEQLAQRKVKAHRVREITNELIREFYGEEVPSATVREFSQSWLAMKAVAVSPGTLEAYRKTVSKFIAFLGPAAEVDISLIRKATITAFRTDVASTVSSTTANFDLKVVQAMFRAAKAGGYLLEDPAEFVEAVRRERREVVRRAFTVDELRALLAAANDEWRSLIRFGLYTGQRLGDIAALTWANLDLERNVIRLSVRKTGKTLVLPIAEPLKTHILGLSAGDNPRAPLHPRAFREVTSKRRKPNALSNQFGDLLVSVGIRARQSQTTSPRGRGGRRKVSELSFHSLRHTAVSLLKDAGIPQAVVQELVGHDSVQMSQQYTHVGIEALQKAAAALPEI